MVGDDAPKSGRRRPSFKMSRRSVAFVWAVSILAFLGVALVLGFVVSLASGEPALYERSFVWLSRFRRLARDYERLSSTWQQLHFVVFACIMLARHANSA